MIEAWDKRSERFSSTGQEELEDQNRLDTPCLTLSSGVQLQDEVGKRVTLTLVSMLPSSRHVSRGFLIRVIGLTSASRPASVAGPSMIRLHSYSISSQKPFGEEIYKPDEEGPHMTSKKMKLKKKQMERAAEPPKQELINQELMSELYRILPRNPAPWKLNSEQLEILSIDVPPESHLPHAEAVPAKLKALERKLTRLASSTSKAYICNLSQSERYRSSGNQGSFRFTAFRARAGL